LIKIIEVLLFECNFNMTKVINELATQNGLLTQLMATLTKATCKVFRHCYARCRTGLYANSS
jgi:hypothetical protein